MRVCLVSESGRWRAQPVDDAGRPVGAGQVPDDAVPDDAVPDDAVPDDAVPDDAVPDDAVPDGAVPDGAVPDGALARLVADRTVWPRTSGAYPLLRARGVRVARAHDVELTEALLLGHEGRWGRPRSFAAAWARLCGAPEPADAPAPVPTGDAADPAQDALFEPTATDAARPLAGDARPLDALVAVHADQERRVREARGTSPGFGLLVAAESAGALAAVEMTERGIPWDPAVHDALLTEALGPRPRGGGRPAKLQALADEIAGLLGEPRLNPDSQPELLRALRRAGVAVASTRRHELRRVDHPVIPPVLAYRELAHLHSANGWAWRDAWVRDGRFRPEYVPGGVVSGRWATRGGGALQIPKAVRGAVVADPGRVLVVADAGQLEPRVLAALSRDPGLVAATRHPDLYTALAGEAFGRADARAEAKIGMLAAMYGGGAGSPALAALRGRFPAALELLETAARTGEDGGTVRSVLGRTSPPPDAGWLDGATEDRAAARRRAFGRFTRNFVVQASAADWAAVLVATLRTRLFDLTGDGPGAAGLVLFQHDEVVVDAPADAGDTVARAVREAGDEATRLVLGGAGVRVPLEAAVVRSYAQKG